MTSPSALVPVLRSLWRGRLVVVAASAMIVTLVQVYLLRSTAPAASPASSAATSVARSPEQIDRLKVRNAEHDEGPGQYEPILSDMFSRDTGSVRQSWTVRDLRGTRFGQKPVYVLTSKRTVSGGEEFA